MCNLYSMTTNVEAIRRLFRVDASSDKSGNLPAMPGIYPDYPAPIVRNGNGGRELTMARWGMPSSQKALMDATKKRAEKLQAKGKRSISRNCSGWSRTAGPRTSGTFRAPIGSAGSAWKTVASRRSRRFPSMTRSTARRRPFGLPRTRAGRCFASRAYGPTRLACAKQRRARSLPTSSLS